MNEKVNDITQLLKIDDSGDITRRFKTIAEQLMRNWYIQQGSVKYQFLEIEFYYFSKNHKDLHKDKVDPKTGTPLPFVYQRNSPKAGVFLLHDSGVDICFKGKVDSVGSDESCGGGLLIRTLLRIEGDRKSIVTGPWDCRDALFNYFDHEKSPELVYKPNFFAGNIAYAKRFNDKSQEPFSHREYCAYATGYPGYSESKDKPWGYDRYDPVGFSEPKKAYTAVPWNRK